MTLQQMRYVIEIAERGSMNEAAKNLFMSQPSLSASIKDLEDEINITVFRRSNKGIELTPEGSEFLGYVRQILDQYALMEDHYHGRNDPEKKFYVSAQHYTFAVEAFSNAVLKISAAFFITRSPISWPLVSLIFFNPLISNIPTLNSAEPSAICSSKNSTYSK